MTMRNVGIVFSPTLGIPAGVFSLMLGEFNRVFNVDEPETSGEEPDDSPAKRNSRHYSDAAADKLLGIAGRSLEGKNWMSWSSAVSYSCLVQFRRQKIPMERMIHWRKKTMEQILQKAVVMQKRLLPA